MEKINIQICVGTTCYIMGSSQLQNLEEYIPTSLKNKVEISGCACLGLCKDENYGNSPFVKVNEQVIHNATINKIIETATKMVKREAT